MTPAPTLTTRRLTLRGPERQDFAAFCDWATGSPRMQALGGPETRRDAWRGYLTDIGHWHWRGFGFFCVVENQTGRVAGRVGVIDHINWPEPELAWHVFDGFEGRSIAFEAACAVDRKSVV